MTDRRDTDRELATLLSDLEETLTQLRGSLGEGSDPVGQTGRERRREAGWHERPPLPRPPGMREVLRFTEQQTIPTLIAILEANIRLLRLAGAALRAVDPERSVDGSGGDSVATRALDASGRLSTDRLASGLGELQDALSGAEPRDPEARQLLADAEQLSGEIREQLRDAGRQRGSSEQSTVGTGARSSSRTEDAVRIEVEDAATGDEVSDTEDASGVDVDSELDSIREEVRGEAQDADEEDDDTDEDDNGGNGERSSETDEDGNHSGASDDG